MSRREKRVQNSTKRIRYPLFALVVLAVFGICFFTVFQPYWLHADKKEPITRGVADKLEQLPLAKRTEQPKAKLGSKENPFLILEIVPYEEYAEFGYHIKGCEPVAVEAMYGRQEMATVGAVNAATVTERGTCYYFSDEPEADAANYDDAPQKDENYGTYYNGYYERVKAGTGSFVQTEDGTLEKDSKGNLIWHTVNEYEKEAYAGETFTDDTKAKLTKIGQRIYTTRENTEEDTVNRVETSYSYENNEDFLTDTLGLTQQEAEDYCVIVKTITPEELNKEPKWVTYANLISVAAKSHVSGLTEVWKKYNRLGHTSEAVKYQDSFVGKDISWEIVQKIYERVTAKKNYAAIMLEDDIYSFGDAMNGSTKNVSYDIKDWNLQSTGVKSTEIGSNNNVYKLAVMLLCMDSDLFRKIYLDGDSPLIQNGKNTLQSGTAADYWSTEGFLFSDPNGEVLEPDKPYAYWTSDEVWENYGISGDLTAAKNQPWVKGHIYAYDGDAPALAGDYLWQGAAQTDSRFDAFQSYVKQKYENADTKHQATPSDAVAFILSDTADETAGEEKENKTLKVLDLEPSVDMDKGYTLTETYLQLMLPQFQGSITLTHMAMAEFIGNADDLNSTYNMIFLGLDCSAYNTAKKEVTVTSVNSGRRVKITKTLPKWTDTAMDGKIYFHTGDWMKSTERTIADGSLSVKFLYSQKTDSTVESDLLRFAGDDITRLKQKELENFMKAGYPVVAVPYLYNTEEAMVDQYSNICSLIQKNKEKGIFNVTDTAGILKGIRNREKTEVSFTRLPEQYSGETASNGKVKNPNYLQKNNVGQSLLQFRFSVQDAANKKYRYRIYVDQNQDGKFAEDEVFYRSSAFLPNGGTKHYTCRLSSLLVGLIQWRIEVYQADNENVRFVKTGCSAAKTTEGNKKAVNVLQIMPKADSQSYMGKLNLQTSTLFKKYYENLEDFKVSITAITLDEFEGYFKNNNDGREFSFDSSKAISYEEDNLNPINYTTKLQEKLKQYNMLIFGFGDTYGTRDISNAHGAVDYIQYVIKLGKSVLFTHDMSSLHNVTVNQQVPYGYTVNSLLRDAMGMNRYAAVSKELSSEDRKELLAYQAQGTYDTVTDQSGKELEQKQGFTYWAAKRLGYPSANATYKMPYRHLIEAYKNTNDSYVNQTGVNFNNDRTTKVSKMNTGQITEYPYKIDDEFSIAQTHGQYYQLNMEDPEVTVWYTLADDGTRKVGKATAYAGTAATYEVSPHDAANNYYIYSKGNVFYSGVGHQEVTGDMEAKLFVNTMIAAYRSSYESPVVEIMNEEAEYLGYSENGLSYQMTEVQEYDADTSADGGKNRVVTETVTDEDMIKILFNPIELNALTSKLDCKLYYLDENGDRIYIDAIYDSDDDEKIEPDNHTFQSLWNMHTYYFYYPKKYLNAWKDKKGEVHEALRQMQFEITSDKVTEPGYTTLDIFVQQLFQLD